MNNYSKEASYTSLEKLFLRVLCLGAVLACLVAPLKAQQPEDKPVRPTSLLVEEGFVLPSQALIKLKSEGELENTAFAGRFIIDEAIQMTKTFKSGSSLKVTFMILEGTARFQSVDGTVATVTVVDGVVMTPAIVSGSTYDESFVRVMVGDETIVDQLRVATLPTGGIENLMRYVSANDSALIALGDHYAVVDENKMTETDESVQAQIQEPGSSDKKTQGDPTIYGLCIRTPFGPGKVNWRMANPGRGGWGYSYKPENAFNLQWATPPSDDIDAIYRAAWGCGTALKVPNSCTVDVNGANISSCCNAAAAALGNVVRWVNPGREGFPNCPLR